jgi:hypothetical protein
MIRCSLNTCSGSALRTMLILAAERHATFVLLFGNMMAG